MEEEVKEIYCTKCGTKNLDCSNYCSKCGVSLHHQESVVLEEPIFKNEPKYDNSYKQYKSYKSSSNTLATVAFVFCILEIIACVCLALFYLILAIVGGTPLLLIYTVIYLIPLAWTIPLTVKVYRYRNDSSELSVGTKIIILIFVNLISGILLLCDGNN